MLCVIVRRGDLQIYDRLHDVFGERAPVVWDRRRAADHPTNGSGAGPRAENRRQAPPPSWVGFGFVVVDRPI